MINKVLLTAFTLASVVFAQDTTSSSSAPNASATPLIPAGTSPGCAAFLTSLNNNDIVNTCLTALITATDAFDPSGTGNTTSTNSDAVTSALSTICSPSFTVQCDPSVIRTQLTKFYTECSSELTVPTGDASGGNTAVIAIYDVLYLILPLKDAVCAKVDGQYCVNKGTSSALSSSSAASSSSSAPASSSSAPATKKRSTKLSPSDLFKRTEGATHALIGRQANNVTSQETLNAVSPSAENYRTSGLPYLFLRPDSATADICGKCTFAVMSAYIRFETVTPYAIGIANSPILQGQLDLWKVIKQCPENFAGRLLDESTGSLAAASRAVSKMHIGGGAIGLLAAAAAAALL